jgi:uncharacterized BrkB/YihY/UPF0761 family membrane protein
MLARAWAEAKREETTWAAWLWDVHERDRACGGGLLAGALAYRLFIWLLPLVLVLVAGLGIVSSAASESPGEIAGRGGLSGLVTASVADAARSGARWYALLIGVPVLLYATRSLLRALIGVHRLVWMVPARRSTPTARQTLAFLALLLVFPLVSSIATAARASSLAVGLVATVTVSLVYAGLWLLVSLLLPHGAASHTALIPGSVVFGVGTFALHVFSAYFVAPLAASRQDTYGSLGAAAALLLGLYFVGRLLVVCAAVNATLWERRHDAGPGAVGTAARS